jgi:hypothetical protein
MDIATNQTSILSRYVMLALWALLPTIAWACATMVIIRFYGAHSTQGIWALFFGIPGVAVGGGLLYVTGSETASYGGWDVSWELAFLVHCVEGRCCFEK